MNYELYRLLNKKRSSKSPRSRFMSQSMVVVPRDPATASKGRPSRENRETKLQSKDTSCRSKVGRLAQKVSMEFSVPRNPNKAKEFSFEKSKSKEMIITDNFSFSEKLQGKLKTVEKDDSVGKPEGGSAKSSSGVLGSICSSIMNRYNSFIQVLILSGRLANR